MSACHTHTHTHTHTDNHTATSDMSVIIIVATMGSAAVLLLFFVGSVLAVYCIIRKISKQQKQIPFTLKEVDTNTYTPSRKQSRPTMLQIPFPPTERSKHIVNALPCSVPFHTETHLSTGSNNPNGISSLNLQPSQLLPPEMIIPVDCVKMLKSIGEGEQMIVIRAYTSDQKYVIPHFFQFDSVGGTPCSLASYPRDAWVQGYMLSCYLVHAL